MNNKIKVGDIYKFTILDQVCNFEIISYIEEKGKKIYCLESKDKDFERTTIYKSKDQLLNSKRIQEIFEKSIDKTKAKRKVRAIIIKEAIKKDLKENASLIEIAYWIWSRGWFARKDEPSKFIKDKRLLDNNIKIPVDAIELSSDIYKECIDYFLSLKKINDWHDLCLLADGVRNPLLPEKKNFHVYINKDNVLIEKWVCSTKFSLNNFIKNNKYTINQIVLVTTDNNDTKKYDIIYSK